MTMECRVTMLFVRVVCQEQNAVDQHRQEEGKMDARFQTSLDNLNEVAER